MQFEYYVLNYDTNKKKVENFNIFRNCLVQEHTEKAVRKYLRTIIYNVMGYFVEKLQQHQDIPKKKLKTLCFFTLHIIKNTLDYIGGISQKLRNEKDI